MLCGLCSAVATPACIALCSQRMERPASPLEPHLAERVGASTRLYFNKGV